MVAKLQREHNLPIPVNEDSFYKPTERKPRKFDLMVIPKALQALLPFESKPKDPPCRKKKLGKLHAEFREPRKRKVRFCTQLQVLKKEKMTKQKENQKRRAQEAMKAKEELIPKKRQREKRRRRCREEDEMKKRKTRPSPES